jgi:hypothetical protein
MLLPDPDSRIPKACRSGYHFMIVLFCQLPCRGYRDFFHLSDFKKRDFSDRYHPVLPGRELQEGVFSSRFPVIPAAASCCGQDVDNCLENRDDDVKEQVPVKHFFAHLP